MNSTSGGEVALASRTRMGLMKYRKFKDLHCEIKFPMLINGSVYKSCVRSAMHYGGETRSIGQNEIGILQRTEGTMVRNMCGVKLVDKKSTIDLMQMMDMNETRDQLARSNSVRWYGHVMRKGEKNFLRRATDLKVKRDKKNGWTKENLAKSSC